MTPRDERFTGMRVQVEGAAELPPDNPPRAKGFNLRVKRWIDKAYDGNVAEAAAATSIPNSTLWQIYRGMTKTPSASVLVKLSSAIGCSIDFLLTGRQHGKDEKGSSGERVRGDSGGA